MTNLYSEPMNLWIPFWVFGLVVMVVLRLMVRAMERNQYCDHGPCDYDSYCQKCGLDS